jgi:hypothetical protein
MSTPQGGECGQHRSDGTGDMCWAQEHVARRRSRAKTGMAKVASWSNQELILYQRTKYHNSFIYIYGHMMCSQEQRFQRRRTRNLHLLPQQAALSQIQPAISNNEYAHFIVTFTMTSRPAR